MVSFCDHAVSNYIPLSSSFPSLPALPSTSILEILFLMLFVCYIYLLANLAPGHIPKDSITTERISGETSYIASTNPSADNPHNHSPRNRSYNDEFGETKEEPPAGQTGYSHKVHERELREKNAALKKERDAAIDALHNERSRSGAARDSSAVSESIRRVRSAHSQKPTTHKQLRVWQQFDMKKIFHALDDSIKLLSSQLHWHIRDSKVLKKKASALSGSLVLIKGVPDVLWLNEEIHLLQGAVWSIILETVFQNDFKVFGERAQSFAQEFAHPKVEAQSMKWRCLTGEQLVTRCGLVQFSSAMSNGPLENVRVILGKEYSIEECISRMTRTNATEHLLDDMDNLALQSIHSARKQFIDSLELLTGHFGARRKLADSVKRVVTDAQVLAIQMVIQPHVYRFRGPPYGEAFRKVQKYQEQTVVTAITDAGHTLDGEIVFTVSPGFEKFESADLQQFKTLHPALVYVTGTKKTMFSPRTLPHVNPSGLPRNVGKSGPSLETSESSMTKTQDNLERMRILAAFKNLKNAVKALANALQYTNALDDFLSVAPLSWDQRTRNLFTAEKSIWAKLIFHLFDNKFCSYAILGEALHRHWTNAYPEVHSSDPSSVSTIANSWRYKEGLKLLESLGGELFLKDPKAAVVIDRKVEDSLQVKKDIVCLDIRNFLDEVCQPAPRTDATSAPSSPERNAVIKDMVQLAITLAIRLDVSRQHYQIYNPARHTPYTRPLPPEPPKFTLTPDCAHLEKGYIALTLVPGLRVYPAADLRKEEHLVPPVVHVTSSTLGDVFYPGLPTTPLTARAMAFHDANSADPRVETVDTQDLPRQKTDPSGESSRSDNVSYATSKSPPGYRADRSTPMTSLYPSLNGSQRTSNTDSRLSLGTPNLQDGGVAVEQELNGATGLENGHGNAAVGGAGYVPNSNYRPPRVDDVLPEESSSERWVSGKWYEDVEGDDEL
ncbi:unnamed protein product [Periconia digitata]|uniref:Uncharacterized protein n=1 Tax=Periconia digitata TaxID=1303443 RepID=A0A9W4U918_9PLEO|nr:unnamed protein product [Periconia digitata]